MSKKLVPLAQLSPLAQALAKALCENATALSLEKLDDHGLDVWQVYLADEHGCDVALPHGVYSSEDLALSSAESGLIKEAEQAVEAKDRLLSQYQRRMVEDEKMAQRLAAGILIYKARVEELTGNLQALHAALTVK